MSIENDFFYKVFPNYLPLLELIKKMWKPSTLYKKNMKKQINKLKTVTLTKRFH